MAEYRYQVTCVGRWRGKIKRWNTTLHTSSSSQTSALHTIFQNVCYPNPGDVQGDCSGGVASIAVYSSTGGAPIQNTIYFDWQTPSEWEPYDGTVWSGLDPQPPLDASGESALLVVGHMAALSASGKPVTTRKYIHAIPSRTAVDYDDPDVDSGIQAAIVNQFKATWMHSPSGVSPTLVTVEPYYYNHQRVRGRRRTTNQVAAQSFSAGVVLGTQGGGGSAPQFR